MYKSADSKQLTAQSHDSYNRSRSRVVLKAFLYSKKAREQPPTSLLTDTCKNGFEKDSRTYINLMMCVKSVKYLWGMRGKEKRVGKP